MLKLSKNVSSMIFVFLLGVSALTSWFVIQGAFPYVGLAFFFSILAAFIYVVKRPKFAYDHLLFIVILFLCGFLIIRANPFLTMLDIIGIFLLGGVLSVNKTNTFTFINLLISPIQAFSQMLVTPNAFEFNKDLLKHPSRLTRGVNMTQLILSILITLGLLVVIIPLLASANPLFNKLITDIFASLHLKNILDFIFGDGIDMHIIRFVVALALFIFALRLGSYAYQDVLQNSTTADEKDSYFSKILLLPKIVVSLVLLLFFITQLQLYLANADTLRALHYTNSKQVNEVFGQLSIVSLIIFVLIYNDRNKTFLGRLSTYILVAEGIFLTGIAFKSDYDYSTTWGFTFKRLYGFAVVSWTTIAYFLFLYKYLQNISNSTLLKNLFALAALMLVVINFANFDYLIYHYNKSYTHAGLDYYYLSQLSSDSFSYKEQLEAAIHAPKKDKAYTALSTILGNIQTLQNKYKDFDIREYNMSEYSQYLEVKDINVEDYNSILLQKRQEYFNMPSPTPTVNFNRVR